MFEINLLFVIVVVTVLVLYAMRSLIARIQQQLFRYFRKNIRINLTPYISNFVHASLVLKFCSRIKNNSL